MSELERNAHCVAFQKDPEKMYHLNDPSRHLLIVYLQIQIYVVFITLPNKQKILYRHSILFLTSVNFN